MTASTVVPLIYDLPIVQGSTLRQKFRFPFAGPDRRAYAQVWKDIKRRDLVLDMKVQVVAFTPRLILEVQAEWTQTGLVKKDGIWDLLIVNPDNTREHWVTGDARLIRTVTEGGPPPTPPFLGCCPPPPMEIAP